MKGFSMSSLSAIANKMYTYTTFGKGLNCLRDQANLCNGTGSVPKSVLSLFCGWGSSAAIWNCASTALVTQMKQQLVELNQCYYSMKFVKWINY